MSEHFCFPLQVDFRVDIGRVDGDMAEPCADGVDIDPGPKKVSGCCMPDSVWADRPVHQPRKGTCGDADVLAEHPMNAMSG